MKRGYAATPLPGNVTASGKNVYILDDDHEMRSSLEFFLESADFAPRAFAAPSDLFMAIDGLGPGCLLVDIRMPDCDGFQVLERIKERRITLPVVIMTAHGDVISAVRAMKLGAYDFLQKPYEEDMLLEILGRAFDALGANLSTIGQLSDVRRRLGGLTERERDVLVGLVSGRSNKQVAYDLGLSVRTIEAHRASMMMRLRVRTFAEAVRMAIEGGIVEPAPSAVFAQAN